MKNIGVIIGWLAMAAGIFGLVMAGTGNDPAAMISAGVGIVLAAIGFFLKANTTRMSITAIGLAVAAILFASISY
ncbi:MAG: hypothetical protein JJU01_05390 [Alkalibacterium sp.]|nr:hypothetical protein [Alkalibacterium sp.]MCC5889984.1 hypothetical protein [Alkalibacterium sp.]TVP91018.1 MAG: hypothetical protein EA249_06375 [Alkalibacterium sp.]